MTTKKTGSPNSEKAADNSNLESTAMTEAERSKLRRQRRRNGEAVLSVPVKIDELVETFIDVGALPAWDAENKKKIGEAVSRVLAKLIRDHRHE